MKKMKPLYIAVTTVLCKIQNHFEFFYIFVSPSEFPFVSPPANLGNIRHFLPENWERNYFFGGEYLQVKIYSHGTFQR